VHPRGGLQREPPKTLSPSTKSIAPADSYTSLAERTISGIPANAPP
jgi:hypothetical protein